MNRIRANGLSFAYLEQGSGPLVVLLHGFPDDAYTWQDVAQRLAGAGWRAVAPFTRGYSPTDIPPDGDYSIEAQARDALALIQALGESHAVIVGHDWGAFAAYVAANIDPARVRKLVTVAIPHPRVVQLSIPNLWRSPHFLLLPFGFVSAWWIKRKNFNYVEHLYRYWAPTWNVPEQQVARIKTTLSPPDRLKAALHYYRALIVDNANPRRARLYRQKTTVPTLTFVGLQDGPMRIEMFDRMAEAFTGPFELVKIATAGHFVHREEPELFASKVLAFLGQPSLSRV